jgi:hypothetical protein
MTLAVSSKVVLAPGHRPGAVLCKGQHLAGSVNQLAARSAHNGAPGCKVKPNSLCTACLAQSYLAAMWLLSAKIGLYGYIAQAAAGAAIGFALPFANLLNAR